MPSVLVTGASRGLGRALVSTYRERGWTVFPLVRDARMAAAWSAVDGARCLPICGDVGRPGVEAEIATTLAAHTGTLDVLINNAGQIRKLRWLRSAAFTT